MMIEVTTTKQQQQQNVHMIQQLPQNFIDFSQDVSCFYLLWSSA